jgi:hypothetical protein
MYYLSICLEGLRKTRKALGRIGGVQAQVRTEHPSSTGLERPKAKIEDMIILSHDGVTVYGVRIGNQIY